MIPAPATAGRLWPVLCRPPPWPDNTATLGTLESERERPPRLGTQQYQSECCMPDALAWFYNKLNVFWNFENVGFWRKLYINFIFFTFLGKKTLFWEIRDNQVKNRFWCLLFAFYFKSLFLVIFQTFINFRPKNVQHWVNKIDIIRKTFKENFHDFV